MDWNELTICESSLISGATGVNVRKISKDSWYYKNIIYGRRFL